MNSGIYATADAGNSGLTGSIVLTAPTIQVRSGATVTIDNYYSGNDGGSGHITVNANEASLLDGGKVTADSHGGSAGGDIVFNIAKGLSIGGRDTLNNQSGIYGRASVDGPGTGTGSGGQVQLNVGSLTMRPGGTIQVATFGDGSAGNLHIGADTIDIQGTDLNNRTYIAAGSGDRFDPAMRGTGSGD